MWRTTGPFASIAPTHANRMAGLGANIFGTVDSIAWVRLRRTAEARVSTDNGRVSARNRTFRRRPLGFRGCVKIAAASAISPQVSAFLKSSRASGSLSICRGSTGYDHEYYRLAPLFAGCAEDIDTPPDWAASGSRIIYRLAGLLGHIWLGEIDLARAAFRAQDPTAAFRWLTGQSITGS